MTLRRTARPSLSKPHLPQVNLPSLPGPTLSPTGTTCDTHRGHSAATGDGDGSLLAADAASVSVEAVHVGADHLARPGHDPQRRDSTPPTMPMTAPASESHSPKPTDACATSDTTLSARSFSCP